MLNYNKGQVLELFKILLFGIQNLRAALESAKQIMTKEKLDNKLAGQISIPYIVP